MKYALTFSVAAVIASSALAQSTGLEARIGDAARGRTIAVTWCSACHLVAPGQSSATAGVPTFMSMAQRLPSEVDVLTAFVANPHPPMPNLSLSRQDIRDVLAYIASLK
jgi:mono/diheme cytochrome c family protein